jgi:hypothetical protein
MAQKSYPKVTTPRGVAIWPRLNTPDTKFNKAGKYEAKIAIDANDAGLIALQAQVEQLIDAKFDEVVKELTDAGKGGLAKKVVKVSPFKPEEDAESGDETGRITLKASMTASGISAKTSKPWSRKPAIFNGKGQLIKSPPAIGGGSILKLNVELFPYYAATDKTVGCSFRLEAAQVIQLVSFGAKDAASCGFGAEEDGDDFGDAESDFGANTGAASDPADGDDDEL